MTITAKFPGVCPCCNGRINAGDKVEWSKGAKATHVACAGATRPQSNTQGTQGTWTAERVTVASMPRRRSSGGGKWTGCSCGSREDSYGQLIPSSRNCRSCEHDA